LKLVYTGQFKKDYRRVTKRGHDPGELVDVVRKLLAGAKLPPEYRDHKLSGPWKNHRECHIKPDWLLVYRIESDELILTRTGSHADLFR